MSAFISVAICSGFKMRLCQKLASYDADSDIQCCNGSSDNDDDNGIGSAGVMMRMT